MSNNEYTSKSSGALHNWLITLAVIFLSIFGVIISLICIYSLPDQTVKPLTGAIFYIGSAVLIVFFLFLRWRKDKAKEGEILSAGTDETDKIIIKETISDKILKWLVTIYAFFFVLDGLAIALICIYALPDKTVQPKVGMIYVLAGAIVLGSFIFVVWKNWIFEKSHNKALHKDGF